MRHALDVHAEGLTSWTPDLVPGRPRSSTPPWDVALGPMGALTLFVAGALLAILVNGLVEGAQANAALQGRVSSALTGALTGAPTCAWCSGEEVLTLAAPRVVDVQLLPLADYAPVPITVTGARPIITSPRLRFLGAYRLSWCALRAGAATVVEPPIGRYGWWWDAAAISAPRPERLTPDAWRTPAERSRHLACGARPPEWVLRVRVIGPGAAAIRGAVVSFRALRVVHHEALYATTVLVVRPGSPR